VGSKKKKLVALVEKDADLFFKEECYKIIGACMKVHRELGSGFLEPVYHEALVVEFNKQGIPFESEKVFKIIYSGVELKSTYVADFVCYDKIVLEIKATSSLSDAHVSQLLNYLNASKMRVGLLVNFGEASLRYKRCAL
jgi:GxxExxY protein